MNKYLRSFMRQNYSAIIQKDDNMFVSICPELDIASQGYSIEEAKMNLKEAIELFLDTASQQEILDRTLNEFYITSLEVQLA